MNLKNLLMKAQIYNLRLFFKELGILFLVIKMLQSIYVDVVALMSKNGVLTPLFIVWDNGVRYKIEKSIIKGQRVCEGGGNGLLYIIKVEGITRRLFYNRFQNAWFIEKQQ